MEKKPKLRHASCDNWAKTFPNHPQPAIRRNKSTTTPQSRTCHFGKAHSATAKQAKAMHGLVVVKRRHEEDAAEALRRSPCMHGLSAFTRVAWFVLLLFCCTHDRFCTFKCSKGVFASKRGKMSDRGRDDDDDDDDDDSDSVSDTRERFRPRKATTKDADSDHEARGSDDDKAQPVILRRIHTSSTKDLDPAQQSKLLVRPHTHTERERETDRHRHIRTHTHTDRQTHSQSRTQSHTHTVT